MYLKLKKKLQKHRYYQNKSIIISHVIINA